MSLGPIAAGIYDTSEYPLDYPTGQRWLEVTAALSFKKQGMWIPALLAWSVSGD